MRKTPFVLALQVVLLILCCKVAWADKLQDFKDAVSKTGCDGIPYTDQRTNCSSQQSDVHSWCDGERGPVSCEVGVTRNILQNFISEQKNNDGLKEKREHLTDNSAKEAIDKEIEASSRKLEDLKKQLEDRKYSIGKIMDTINKCIDYRRAVMNTFAYALDKVRNENEPEIKPYAEQLRDRYEESKSGHETQITNRENSLDTCKKELP
jgi:hypothetical protein